MNQDTEKIDLFSSPEHIERVRKEADEFREQYKKDHEACPKCGHTGHSSTLVGYVLDLNNKESYKDGNQCVCSNCGDKHIYHDRISKEKFDRQTNSLCKVVHCKKEEYDVYIGRPSKWGNPFTHKQGTQADKILSSRQEAVDAYREWITSGDGRHLLKDLHELKDKTLGCWCSPLACHGDVLSDLVTEKFKEK